MDNRGMANEINVAVILFIINEKNNFKQNSVDVHLQLVWFREIWKVENAILP